VLLLDENPEPPRPQLRPPKVQHIPSEKPLRAFLSTAAKTVDRITGLDPRAVKHHNIIGLLCYSNFVTTIDGHVSIHHFLS
jgi:hypothetical protein